MRQVQKGKKDKPSNAPRQMDDAVRNRQRPLSMFLLVFVGWVLLAMSYQWISFLGLILMAGGMAIGLIDDYRRGEIRTNWGTVRRERNPILFKIEHWFWSSALLAFFLFFALKLAGFIQ